jgi:adenine deaminase
MEREGLKKLIDTAAGRLPADLVIKNCKVIDVYNCAVIEGDIALCGRLIAGVGKYDGVKEIDAKGLYASPGFIDSHIHVESSYLSPEELGRLIVPRGTTTIISDPHEIVNVCGIKGLDYMIEASRETSLDIKWMLPSCVPATPFEHSGSCLDAKAMAEQISRDEILGLGEFMDYPGVAEADGKILDKLIAAKKQGKLIDGHIPEIDGLRLNAYAVTGIRTDHECSSVKEMHDRISRGMYVLLRQG